MKKFTSINDVENLSDLLKEALLIKAKPFKHQHLGRNKSIGLVFLNPSLRTRLSSQKAAANLGMTSFVLNVAQESWALEFEDGAIMNGSKVEHIKDAAPVLAQYCDIVALRCFPGLVSIEEDYSEKILNQFIKYCPVPVVSLESATRHPLQSFADLITIHESFIEKRKPKIVLTWAPHIKALPQAVPNSFAEWMLGYDCEFVIAQPAGYELSDAFTKGAKICHSQNEALMNADFVYVKNWSSFNDYGKTPTVTNNWLLDKQKMQLTNQAHIMHCLPVRRNVELSDELLDSERSLVMKQAANRVVAAQTIFKKVLEWHSN